MTQPRYASSMSRHFTSRRDPDKVKREGWLETGILAVDPKDERLNWMESRTLINIGEKLYGKRS